MEIGNVTPVLLSIFEQKRYPIPVFRIRVTRVGGPNSTLLKLPGEGCSCLNERGICEDSEARTNHIFPHPRRWQLRNIIEGALQQWMKVPLAQHNKMLCSEVVCDEQYGIESCEHFSSSSLNTT